MTSRIQRLLVTLDLEERILTCACLSAFVSVFFPWLSGQWLSDEFASYSGVEFFTAWLGVLIALMYAGVLVLTIVPAAGGPVMMKRKHREIARVLLSGQATILTLAALSVLINVTYDYTRMDIRFGVYFAFAGGLVSTFYACWKFQEFRKGESHEAFRHPEDMQVVEERRETMTPPPPPPLPPEPSQPEDHRIRA